MKIKQKLTFSLLVIILLTSTIGFFCVMLSKQIYHLKSVELQTEQTVREIEESIWEMIQAADSFKFTSSDFYEQLYKKQVDEVDKLIPKYKKLATSDQEMIYFNELVSLWNETKKNGHKMLELTKQQKKEEQELFINVDEADDVIDFLIQAKWPLNDPNILAKEQAVREVEVSIWEAIHAAQQFTGLANTIVRGEQKYVGTKLKAAKAAATASLTKGDFAKLMETQFNDVKIFWKKYKELPLKDFEKKAVKEFEKYWNKAVIAGRNLVIVHKHCNEQFDALYDKVKRIDKLFDSKIHIYVQERINTVNDLATYYKNITISLVIISIIFALFLVFIFNNSISKPLHNLSLEANRIVDEQNLTILFTENKKKDEVALLINSFNKLINSLRTCL